MMPDSGPRRDEIAHRARHAGRDELARALETTRAGTLALFAAYEQQLASQGMVVPLSPELNPPLWELGHVGWFQEWWIARNRERALGIDCDPDSVRHPSRLAGADALFDSGKIPHDDRWSLPLSAIGEIKQYLRDVLEDTLGLLSSAAEDDASLYFFRLVLFHEQMHAEAGIYMAQTLGLPIRAGEDGEAFTPASAALHVPGCTWRLGAPESGFAFDNECGVLDVKLAPFSIDDSPVSWARFLPFVEADGYGEARWWSEEGWRWRTREALMRPRYLRKHAGNWQRKIFDRWLPLDPSAAAVHLSFHEAEAWCRWAGRRLPSEAEWECAAGTLPSFTWGEVWEWTASPFEPFPGFVAHPYRDYSAPWFTTRQVLRGACAATSVQMRHLKYRNFFLPARNDIFAGFRSCAFEK